MKLQETLLELFNVKIERSNLLTNWYAKDLKTFSCEELTQLMATCRGLANTPKLKSISSDVRARIIKEKVHRYVEKNKPKINLQKNKGKKNARRTKNNKKPVSNSTKDSGGLDSKPSV